jgi:sec-independent protein translocase protein TatB
MFDIGWSEMAVIALLTLIVIGPKELPRVLRTVGQWVRKAQSLAREFQRGLDDMAREADLEDAKKLVDAGRSIANPKKMIMDTLDPTGSVGDEAKELQTAITAQAPDGEAAGKAEKSEPQADGQSGKPSREAGAAASPDPAGEGAVAATAIKQSGNSTPAQSNSPPSEAKAKPKPKAKPRAKAKPAPEPAGSDGSQKTA